MPILNFDKTYTDMPDLKENQQCDDCGLVISGYLAYYAYFQKTTGVLCENCRRTRLAIDPASAALQPAESRGQSLEQSNNPGTKSPGN